MPEGKLRLRGDFDIETPEQVSFRMERAGIGSRIGAAIIDSILLTLLYLVLLAVLGTVGALSGLETWFDDEEALSDAGLWATGLLMILVLFLFWGYYIGFEGIWNGQTPGKRVLNIRVVSDTGVPATFGAIVIRNLLRVIDWQFGYTVGLIAIFATREEKRLGDLAAGTILIREGLRASTSAIRFGDARGDGRRVDPELLDVVRDFYERVEHMEEGARRNVAGELVDRLNRSLGRTRVAVLKPESELVKLATELMERG